jgi:H+/Cl- antiporter ClcA
MPQFQTTPFLMSYATLIPLLAAVLLQLLIGFGLNRDAFRLQERGRETVFFGPAGWFFLGLCGGLLAMSLYWVIHYSTFRARD